MGFTPQEIGAMSLWQMLAAQDGYRKGNGGGDKPKASHGKHSITPEMMERMRNGG